MAVGMRALGGGGSPWQVLRAKLELGGGSPHAVGMRVCDAFRALRIPVNVGSGFRKLSRAVDPKCRADHPPTPLAPVGTLRLGTAPLPRA